MKRTPIRAVSDKRRRRDGIYATRRRQVFERADGLCEFCRAGGCEQVHHIAGRGGDDPHRLSNLIGLCAACHRRAHLEPEWAREVGLMETRLGKLG